MLLISTPFRFISNVSNQMEHGYLEIKNGVKSTKEKNYMECIHLKAYIHTCRGFNAIIDVDYAYPYTCILVQHWYARSYVIIPSCHC